MRGKQPVILPITKGAIDAEEAIGAQIDRLFADDAPRFTPEQLRLIGSVIEDVWEAATKRAAVEISAGLIELGIPIHVQYDHDPLEDRVA